MLRNEGIAKASPMSGSMITATVMISVQSKYSAFSPPTRTSLLTAACVSEGYGSLPGHPSTGGQATVDPMQSGYTERLPRAAPVTDEAVPITVPVGASTPETVVVSRCG